MTIAFWLVVAVYLGYALRIVIQDRRLAAHANEKNLEMETL